MESLKERAQVLKQTADEVRKWQEVKQNLINPEQSDTTLIPAILEWVTEICEKDEKMDTFKYDPNTTSFCV